MMDITDLINEEDEDFNNGEITIIRTVETVNSRGRPETSSTSQPAMANVQPATPKELERLPEADRVNETIAVRVCAEIEHKTKIVWKKKTYTVVSIEEWPDFVVALAQRESFK